MKKTLIALAAVSISAVASAQSAVDAYNLSQTELRGTARFMAMGGAFTALGGDLSTLNQNPAGIGVYRRSEIGVTLDISPRKITSETPTTKLDKSQTKAYCNNFGYVGTARLDGALRTFSWGASYNRIASFDRVYNVYDGNTASSLSNYIADYSRNYSAGDMEFGSGVGGYNPYLDSDIDWLSILAYSSFMINPDGSGYRGLFKNNTIGDAYSQVRESGYIDEYAIDFGGNVEDVFYWGLGFGITDLSYNISQSYSESMENAYIYTPQGMTSGDAGFDLRNYRSITGSGWNFKAGVILRPINEFRIGLAVHTPTWYSLQQSAYATTDFSYYNPAGSDVDNPISGSDYTEDSYYDFRLHSPWKIMVGAAAVIGNSAIVSVDYERQAFGDMKVKSSDGYGIYYDNDYVNDDISAYYKATNIIRLGAEYRVTPSFSLRAGYSYASTNVKSEAADGAIEIFTAGMDPSYVMNKDTNTVSVGLGYKYKAFYIDGAYVYRGRKATYHAYTNSQAGVAPKASLTDNTNSIVLSAGFKF